MRNHPLWTVADGGFRTVPVALHHVVAANGDLAHLALGHIGPSVAEEPELHPVDGCSDRAGLALAVGVVERGDRRGLRQSVALEDDAPEGRLEAPEDLDREGGAAGHAAPQPGHVVAVAVGVLEQRHVHGRHTLEDGHPVARDHLQRLAGFEAGQQGERRPGRHRGVQTAGLSERMEQRQPAEDDVVGRGSEQPHRHVGVPTEVGVGQFGTLGLAGGPRGVEDDGGVVVVPIGDSGRRGESRQHHLELAGCDGHHLGAGLGRTLGRLLGAPGPGDDDAGAGVAEVVGHLPGLEQRVHRHHDAAGPQDPVVRHREGQDVGDHDPDPVAGSDAALDEQGREPGTGVIEFGVGEHPLVEPHRRVGGSICGRRRQPLGEVGHDRSSRWRPSGWSAAGAGV